LAALDTEDTEEAASEGSKFHGILSFVRRSTRMTDGQQNAWDRLGTRMRVEVPRGVAPTSVGETEVREPVGLFGRDARLVLEIGSGQGQAIVHAAAQRPDTNFLAVEVFRAGLARTMAAADREGLSNVRVVEANAPEVLQRLLPQACVDEMWVFFSDPWHKAKHNKRRLISPDFAGIAARSLKPGGVLRLATDWEHYALQMRRVFDNANDFERDFAGDWAERFDGRVMTVFERKGEAAGRAIRDLTYRRLSQDPAHPPHSFGE
jgi:tRNA (guanine-N7-)-methyltransferase